MPRPNVRPGRPALRPGGWRFYAASLLALFCLYALALWATFHQGPAWALLDAVPPIAAIALTAPVLRILLLRLVLRLGAWPQAAAHALLALIFTVLLYWLDQVLIGVAIAHDPIRFTPPDFFAPAAAWQMVQGVMLYAVVGLCAYVEVLLSRLETAPSAARVEAEAPSRLFVKQDDEFRPIDPAGVILARGADDYAEIETASGVHLVRMSLARLGEKLGPGFVRVHRSCLVNLDHVGKAEPAGGSRMLLHMDNGSTVTTSRVGARLIRASIV